VVPTETLVNQDVSLPNISQFIDEIIQSPNNPMIEPSISALSNSSGAFYQSNAYERTPVCWHSNFPTYKEITYYTQSSIIAGHHSNSPEQPHQTQALAPSPTPSISSVIGDTFRFLNDNDVLPS